MYRVSPGANGRFDGVAPTGDDLVNSFDVGVYGITDGEALGYSPTRDTLFMSDPSSGKIIEVTKDGALVQTIDVSGLGMVNPADITLAPATDDPTRTDMYVVTRGIDNDAHPDENDGVMYEISAPDLGPTGSQTNTAPVVSAGPDQTVTLPSSAILQGTVKDDGLPNPPGFTTSSWTKVNGPGTVTFGDATAASTTASFSAAGTYLLRLTGSDSALTSADDVTVAVSPQSTTNTAPSVFAGIDQTITLPGSAALSGTVSDDGLPNPPAATTVTWSEMSGPGNVTFSNASSTSTLASFTLEGTYVLRLTASDSALGSSDDITVVVQPAPATGNLVKNPGFEVDTTGWRAPTNSGTTLTRVASPHAGGWSGQMDNTNTVTTTARCTLTDNPNWIGTSQPGSYTVSVWVKGDAAGVGATVSLLAREYDKTNTTAPPVGSNTASAKLTTEWQKLELTYVPVLPGSTTIDVSVERAQTPAGATCFLADDFFAGTVQQNTPPVVNAGSDATVTLPNTASLDGTVTDDGLPNPPAKVTTTWSKVSGPGTVTFGDSAIVDTTAAFSAAGIYVLRLTASDGTALPTSDDVQVTVNPAPVLNTAPVVSAGPDATVTLPNAATLDGTVSDDGLPNPPAKVTTTWSKVSGPGTVTFADPAKVDTTATFSAAGTYVLQLSAGDGSLTTTDNVQVTVNPVPNKAPIVSAGADATVTLPGAATLDGTVTDDGLPNPPAKVTTTWSKVSGPVGGTVAFADPAKVDTTATFTLAGTYKLQLTASDGSLTTTDDVQLTVKPVPNTAPVVNAGTDATVQLPNTASLNGAVTDDGLPNPPAKVTTTWSKVSGPSGGTVAFADASKVDTNATFSAAGTYVLRLTGFDGALSTSDEVQVTVQAASPGPGPGPGPSNTAPVVSAGADASVQLPGTATLDGTVTDDGLPNPPAKVTTTWSKVSGPGAVSFGDAAKVDTTAAFSVAGTYVLRLTAGDGALTASDDVQVVVQAAPPAPTPEAPTVTVSVSDRTVMVGGNVLFSVDVSRGVVGQSVHLQRWDGSAWVDVETALRTAGDATTLAFTTSSDRSGVVLYRIQVPAYGGVPEATVEGLKVGYYQARITAVSAKGEWVTVRNTGAVTFDLDGWTLRNRSNGRMVVLEPMRVRPGQTVRIHTGTGRDDRNDMFLGRKPMWGRHGVAVLRDDVRQLADRFRY